MSEAESDRMKNCPEKRPPRGRTPSSSQPNPAKKLSLFYKTSPSKAEGSISVPRLIGSSRSRRVIDQDDSHTDSRIAPAAMRNAEESARYGLCDPLWPRAPTLSIPGF